MSGKIKKQNKSEKQEKSENYSDIVKKSMDRAFRGGISGGIAMAKILPLSSSGASSDCDTR